MDEEEGVELSGMVGGVEEEVEGVVGEGRAGRGWERLVVGFA